MIDSFSSSEKKAITLKIMKGRISCRNYHVTVLMDGEQICGLIDRVSDIVSIESGDHEFRIIAKNEKNTYETTDHITITNDSTLKIKHIHNGLQTTFSSSTPLAIDVR